MRASDFAPAVGVTKLAPGAEQRLPKPAAPKSEEDDLDYGGGFTLEDAGYDAQPPASRYAVTISPDMKSADGQTLGYTWLGIVDNWHMRAFTSFGDGQGVWEKDGGALLPFYARNMADVTQWAAPVATSDLMPLLVRLRDQSFRQSPSGAGIMRKIGGTARPDPVARPRPLAGARIRRHRHRLGRGPRRGDDPALAPHRRRATRADEVVGGPGHEPRHHGQGQPAEHADLRHAPRHRRAGRGRHACRSSAPTTPRSGRGRRAPTAWRSRPTHACAIRTTGGSSTSS